MTIMITFASLKGGVSKTTHAAALTAGLIDRGQSVRLIDLDEQGSASAWGEEASQVAEDLQAVYVSTKGADFIEMQDRLTNFAEGPDFVIVDTAGSADPGLAAALFLADLVLVPFTLSELDIEGLHRTKATYDLTFERLDEENPGALVGLYKRDTTFPSNIELAALEDLSKSITICSGLRTAPSIKKWYGNYRTPKQIRGGELFAETTEPISQTNLAKAEEQINSLTDRIMELFNDAQSS